MNAILFKSNTLQSTLTCSRVKYAFSPKAGLPGVDITAIPQTIPSDGDLFPNFTIFPLVALQNSIWLMLSGVGLDS